VASGTFALGPALLENMRKRKIANDLVSDEKWVKKHNEYVVLLAKVQALKKLNKTTLDMNVSELRLLCSWFKRVGDQALPSTRPLLTARYEETRMRGDQIPPPRPIGAPGDVAAPPPGDDVAPTTGIGFV